MHNPGFVGSIPVRFDCFYVVQNSNLTQTYLEGKKVMFVGVLSENERCAGVRVLLKVRHTLTHPRESDVASVGLQNEQREEKLQGQSPRYCAPVDLHIVQAPSLAYCA